MKSNKDGNFEQTITRNVRMRRKTPRQKQNNAQAVQKDSEGKEDKGRLSKMLTHKSNRFTMQAEMQ